MQEDLLRRQLKTLLEGHGAHAPALETLEDFPYGLAGKRLPGSPHTPWRLLEHMRIAQWDILEFCRNPGHVSPEFPDGYWPEADDPAGRQEWDAALARFRNDLEEMGKLVLDPGVDILAEIPHGQGQTILREALLVADHNAYHLGQMMLMRRTLEAQPLNGG
ncbi:MAG: DinB family protein [Candidatus Eisenbacteria bacterium]|nr:DinB family protein [Candidatus Eisenbacteria bacterium]